MPLKLEVFPKCVSLEYLTISSATQAHDIYQSFQTFVSCDLLGQRPSRLPPQLANLSKGRMQFD